MADTPPQRKAGRTWLLKGVALLAGLVAAVCVWQGRPRPTPPRALLRPLEGAGLYHFSPDGKFLATLKLEDGLVPVPPIQVWDTATGAEAMRLPVDYLLFSPDSRLVAACNRRIFDSSGKISLKVFDLRTGAEVNSLKMDHRCDVIDIAFFPGGDVLAMDHYGETNTADSIKLWKFSAPEKEVIVPGWARSLAFSPDGKRATCIQDRISQATKLVLCDVGPGPLLSRRIEHPLGEDEVAVSPDLKSFITASYPHGVMGPTVFRLRDMVSGRVMTALTHEEKKPDYHHFSFSPDGKRLIVVSESPTVSSGPWKRTLWDLSGAPAAIGTITEPVVLSPDGKWLAVRDETGVDLLEVPTVAKHAVLRRGSDSGFVLPAIYGGQKSRAWASFSPDGSRLVVTGIHGREKRNALVEWVLGWFRKPGPEKSFPVARVWDVRTGKELAAFAGCTEAEFSPDGKTLATLHDDGVVKLWGVPSTAAGEQRLWFALIPGAIAVLAWALSARGKRCPVS